VKIENEILEQYVPINQNKEGKIESRHRSEKRMWLVQKCESYTWVVHN
jgi:hypothetical protein